MFPALLMLMLIRLVVFDVIGLLLLLLLFVGGMFDKSLFSVVALLHTLMGIVRCVDVATLTVQPGGWFVSACAIVIASS